MNDKIDCMSLTMHQYVAEHKNRIEYLDRSNDSLDNFDKILFCIHKKLQSDKNINAILVKNIQIIQSLRELLEIDLITNSYKIKSTEKLQSKLTTLTRNLFIDRKVKSQIISYKWTDKPNFHIDTCYISIILPIQFAPTNIVNSKVTLSTSDFNMNVPLESINVSNNISSDMITISNDDELVVIKGASFGHYSEAAAHSPPCHLLNGVDINKSYSKMMAHAIIIEII